MKKSINECYGISTMCTGCKACELICPTKCISMKIDKEGFWYPSVDLERCVKCGNCSEHCHVLRDYPLKDINEYSAYYAWGNDNIRSKSSSGGAFSLLVDFLLSNDGGFVVGAGFSDDWFTVKHIICASNNYAKLRKSKYVISDLNNTYSQVKTYLDDGVRIIFSGTPCQISGLKCFLGKDYDNLYTVDILCHGVPSQELYRQHLDYLRKCGTVQSVDFRPEEGGWDPVHTIKVVIKDSDGNERTYIENQLNDFYLYNFAYNNSLRKSCYSCHYGGTNHQSDFTVGDFWNAHTIKPGLDCDKGASLIICNSSRAKNIIKNMPANTIGILEPRDIAYVFNDGHSWYNKDRRKEFFANIDCVGVEQAEIVFSEEANKRRQNEKRPVQVLKRKIKKFVKNIILSK